MSVLTVEQTESLEAVIRRRLRWWHIVLPLLVLFFAPLILDGVLSLVFATSDHGVRAGARMHLLSGDLQKDFVKLQIAMAASYIAMLLAMGAIARTRGAVSLSGYFSPIARRTAWLAFGSGLP